MVSMIPHMMAPSASTPAVPSCYGNITRTTNTPSSARARHPSPNRWSQGMRAADRARRRCAMRLRSPASRDPHRHHVATDRDHPRAPCTSNRRSPSGGCPCMPACSHRDRVRTHRRALTFATSHRLHLALPVSGITRHLSGLAGDLVMRTIAKPTPAPRAT